AGARAPWSAGWASTGPAQRLSGPVDGAAPVVGRRGSGEPREGWTTPCDGGGAILGRWSGASAAGGPQRFAQAAQMTAGASDGFSRGTLSAVAGAVVQLREGLQRGAERRIARGDAAREGQRRRRWV